MLDKVKKIALAIVAILISLALTVSWVLRRRSSGAQKDLLAAERLDMSAQRQIAADKARLEQLERSLSTNVIPLKRTAADILSEQRRRGQVIE